MTVNVNMTRLAIQGYVDRAKAEGHHPSEPFAIPLSLAEWEALLKFEHPEERRSVDVEGRDFYELCQQYRHSSETPRYPGMLNTIQAFEALKEYVKTGKLPWPSYETGSEPQ